MGFYMGSRWVDLGLIFSVILKLFFFLTGYALYANTVGQKFFWGIFSVSKIDLIWQIPF